ATKPILPNTILGIYTGILLSLDEDERKISLDLQSEIECLQKQRCGGFNKLDSYAFNIDLGSDVLCLSGYCRGNALLKINASTTHGLLNQETRLANVSVSQVRYNNGVPFIVFYTDKLIEKDAQLLFDYGRDYWEENKSNYCDLATHDAPIYSQYMDLNKKPLALPFIKFLKYNYRDVYKKLMQTSDNIFEVHDNVLTDADRVVTAITIDNSVLNSSVTEPIPKGKKRKLNETVAAPAAKQNNKSVKSKQKDKGNIGERPGASIERISEASEEQKEEEMLAGVANLDEEENNEKENMYEEEEIENIYEEEEAMEVMEGNG
ncbi:hypothetical protein, partial [Candidatus Cardinium hertigii]|uniref:hypothetical protein n=1 Tax=Candidatus Cardinium hertigii TaxID=247481 RepID=UPI00161CE2EC